MNNSNQLKAEVRALLDEYKRAINELIKVITPISSPEFEQIVDTQTQDPDCVSIRSVLIHVISSGNAYTNYFENSIGLQKQRPEIQPVDNSQDAIQKLNLMYEYCEDFFYNHTDIEIGETENEKKILTRWGQRYDIDQLFEHAIVHILRHRRQIERFLTLLSVS